MADGRLRLLEVRAGDDQGGSCLEVSSLRQGSGGQNMASTFHRHVCLRTFKAAKVKRGPERRGVSVAGDGGLPTTCAAPREQ